MKIHGMNEVDGAVFGIRLLQVPARICPNRWDANTVVDGHKGVLERLLRKVFKVTPLYPSCGGE